MSYGWIIVATDRCEQCGDPLTEDEYEKSVYCDYCQEYELVWVRRKR